MAKMTLKELKESFADVALDDMLLATILTLINKFDLTKEDLKISLKALYDDANENKRGN